MKEGADVEGLFLWAGRGLLSAEEARRRAWRLAALAVAVAWLPLQVLAVVDDVAWTERLAVPLWKDFLPYGQFLLSVPALILGEVLVTTRLTWAVAELRRSEILSEEDKAAFNTVLGRVATRWRRPLSNVVLAVVTLAATAVSIFGVKEWLTGSWQAVDGRMTLPGWWYLVVSMSLLRFLALRWFWRLVLWTGVLWRLSRLTLRPRPMHPDRAGGLGFLGVTQASFGVLIFAFGVQVSCLIADAVRFGGADLMAFRGQILAFVLLLVLIPLLPLFVFAPALARAREEHMFFVSGSGYYGSGYLERRLRGLDGGGLPTDDISGLADFGTLYENARRMRPLPLEPRHLLLLLLSAVLPFLPLVFLVIPARDVFNTLAGLLL